MNANPALAAELMQTYTTSTTYTTTFNWVDAQVKAHERACSSCTGLAVCIYAPSGRGFEMYSTNGEIRYRYCRYKLESVRESKLQERIESSGLPIGTRRLKDLDTDREVMAKLKHFLDTKRGMLQISDERAAQAAGLEWLLCGGNVRYIRHRELTMRMRDEGLKVLTELRNLKGLLIVAGIRDLTEYGYDVLREATATLADSGGAILLVKS